MRYLLDADWIIHLLHGRQDFAKRVEHFDPDDIAICLVTVAEVYEEAFTFANPQAHLHTFREFVSNFQLLNLTLPIIEKFAELRSYLRRRGEIVSDFDILLGSTALEYDLTVLTENRRHFARIPDLKLVPLKIKA